MFYLKPNDFVFTFFIKYSWVSSFMLRLRHGSRNMSSAHAMQR